MHADALDGGVEWFAANGELESQSREAAESLRVAAQCIRVEIVGGFAVFQAVGRVRGRRGQTIGTNGTDAIRDQIGHRGTQVNPESIRQMLHVEYANIEIQEEVRLYGRCCEAK